MNTRTLVIILILMMALVGCGFTGVGDGRMEAWQKVRVEEEKSDQEFLKTKAAEFEAKKSTPKEQNPTFKVTSYDADGKVISVSEMDLQPMFAELGIGKEKESSTYGVDMTNTDIPEGQIAESFKAGGSAASQVLSAPGTVAITVGHYVEKAADGGGDTDIQAENLTIKDSLNDTEIHGTGEGNKVDYKGTADAQIVEKKESDE